MSRSDEFFKIYFGWLIIKVYGWSRHLCRVKGVELNEQHAVSDPDRVADEVASLVQMSVSLSLSLLCQCINSRFLENKACLILCKLHFIRQVHTLTRENLEANKLMSVEEY